MQTNNDTHGPENKFSSTWCREFGAAAPRHNALCVRHPGAGPKTRVSLRRICSPIDRRTEQKQARQTNGEEGLPILALGKGTSAGPALTQCVKERMV